MKNRLFIVVQIIGCLSQGFGFSGGLCPAGFSCRNFKNSSPPIPCPPGTFSVLGQHDCTPCAPGYYTNHSASESCAVCEAGFMCPFANQNPVACPVGTYTSCTRQSCCSVCPVGTYNTRIASTDCEKCPAGASCRPASPPSCDSAILTPEYQITLNQFAGKTNPLWKLIYKATRDGFLATDFHYHCNDKTETMTLINSKDGYIFGGYAQMAWSSGNSYIRDPKAFVFTLKNPHSIPPTRFLVKSGYESYALYAYASYGPTFGNGPDILVPDRSNLVKGTFKFGSTYTDTTGRGSATFTGSSSFEIGEILVYQLFG
ncbi:unnamed protein product [Rotaria magnacalcarata]|uniref:TLDc domain-containing protein n=3 Tax=Rotaria magnacalcarata TaxID=392030 RepID=A0A814MT71_9BILA|nr:unnamed protein product [Rotaria magnacalcarata]CAF1532250.1 unnamed protein product [Rotaria magnacalcarata]